MVTNPGNSVKSKPAAFRLLPSVRTDVLKSNLRPRHHFTTPRRTESRCGINWRHLDVITACAINATFSGLLHFQGEGQKTSDLIVQIKYEKHQPVVENVGHAGRKEEKPQIFGKIKVVMSLPPSSVQ